MTRGDWFIVVSIVVELSLLIAALQLGTGIPFELLDRVPELNFAGGMLAILALGATGYRVALRRWGR